MTAEEQSIEQGGLPLRRQRIDFFRPRFDHHKNSSIIAPESVCNSPRAQGAILTRQLCHYFPLPTLRLRSFWALGEEETISKNNETINNPAIAAPINISDPIPLIFCLARQFPSSS